MAKYRYVFENIGEYEYKYAERHLEEMAKDGWMLENAGRIFWKYRKIEPQAKKFSVTYLPGASPFDPEITEEEEQLKEYCSEAGWYKVADWGIMKIFANDEENPVPIDTDEKLRFEAYKASRSNTVLLRTVLGGGLLLILLPIIAILGLLIFADPVMVLGDLTFFLLVITFFLALIVPGVPVLAYWSWLEKSEEQIEQGGTCIETRGPGIMRKGGVICLLIAVVTLLLSQIAGGFVGTAMGILLHFIWLIFTGYVAYKVSELMRKKGIRRNVNIAVWIVLILVLLGITRPWIYDAQEALYQYDEVGIMGTPWLYNPEGELQVENTKVEYEVVEVRSDVLWDFCVKEYLTGYDGVYEESDAAVWGADKAYTFIPTEYEEGEVTWIGEPDPDAFIEYAGSYLLLKDNYIVWVGLSEDMENKKDILDAVLDAI